MKKRTIIDIILIFLLLGLLVFLGTRDYSKKTEGKDSKIFDSDYSMVSKDNVFKYASDEEILDIMQSGNGIIFMGFKENEWCNYYAKMLNDAAKKSNIETIYYYDFLADREKKSVNYTKIVNYIKDYLKKDDKGEVNLVAPSVIVFKDNIVIYYDAETSLTASSITPNQYWQENTMNNKIDHFNLIFDNYLGGENGGEE